MARPALDAFADAAKPAVLFATDIPNNLLQLHSVIVNEFHVLSRFFLISLCDEPIQVTLDSNLGSQLGFQLHNENLGSADESSEDVHNFASFLADDFNELFNTVNLVQRVTLQPRQVQQVILTFRPSDSVEESIGGGNVKDEGETVQFLPQELLQLNPSLELPKSKFPGVNQNFRVNGKIFLSATSIRKGNGPYQAEFRQDIVVQFSSTVCRSLLRADVADIVFDDCVPGGVFVKDFSIWNLSEIPCAFQLHVKSAKPELPILDLTDYDTGLPVTGGEIKSCAHKRIRVTFKSRDLGEYNYTIHLDNNYDGRNSISIPVQCLVNAENRQEGILVTGVGEDGVLDFGDCYSENTTCQMLTLRNITQEALVVSFGTDHAHGDQVAFYMQSDLEIPAASAKFHPKDSNNIEDALGKSVDCTMSPDKKNRVEETCLERGEEKNMLVCLYPMAAGDEMKAMKLQRRSFRVSLKCTEKKGHTSHSKQGFSKIIQCKARVCTSIVKLSTSELNLADCNVGSSKTASVEILNMSDLPALITAHVTSTILSFKSKAERVSLLPREAYSLNMEIVPLKINLKYRKQVRIDNLLNKGNQQLLEIRAKIIDRHYVLLHSLYYKLQTPSMNNLLSLDRVILNNPSIRILTIENVTNKDLVLDFSTSMPGELDIFQIEDEDLIADYEEQASQGQASQDIMSHSDSSEDDSHERKRPYAQFISREKLLESLEGSQPQLSKSLVSPFLAQQGGQALALAERPPVSAKFDTNAHNRLSFDLSNSDNSDFLGIKTSVHKLRRPEVRDDTVTSVKPLTGSGDVHVSSMKRVHSSAMLMEGKSLVAKGMVDEMSHERFAEVIRRFSEMAVTEFVFSEDGEATKFVDRQIKDRKLIMGLLEDASCKLRSVGRLELLPGEKKALYVFIMMKSQSHPSVQGRLQNFEAKVNIRLVDYDKQLQDQWEPGMVASASGDEIPTRELPVFIQACRAVLSLAQKNINFGKMLTNEHRAKTLVLNNNSDLQLLYQIKKTGSIASGDLYIKDGRLGVLPPHCNQEVHFVFQPSLSGSFQETLTVNNIYDPSNDQVVTLKATISRADTFWLDTSKIDFGTIIAGQWCTVQRVMIRNTSKQTRTFTLTDSNYFFDGKERSDIQNMTAPSQEVYIRFIAEPKRSNSQTVLHPDEEAIEALKRKIVAFERKGKGEKAAKLWRQIEEMRSKTEVGGKDSSNRKHLKSASNDAATSDDRTTDGKLDPHNSLLTEDLSDSPEKTLPDKGQVGGMHFTLKGGDTQAVLVSCFLSLETPCLQTRHIQGAFLAYEGKNQDVVKHVYYEASVLPGNSASGIDFSVLSKADLLNLPKLDLSLLEVSSSYPASPSPSLGSSDCATPYAEDTPALPHSLSQSSSFVSYNACDTLQAPEADVTLDADMWRSPYHLSLWGMSPPVDRRTSATSDFDHPGLSNGSSNGPSRPGSYGSLYPFEALLRIESWRSPHRQVALASDLSLISTDTSTDISSAADLARSLSSTHGSIQSSCANFVLNLDDNSDHDGFEGSFVLRSTSSQDILAQLSFVWDRAVPKVEIWVEELGVDSVERGGSGLVPKDLPVSRDSSEPSSGQSKERYRQLLPLSHEHIVEGSGTAVVASTYIKGWSASRIQLYVSDQASQLPADQQVDPIPESDSLENVTGLLSITTQPSDGTRHQLNICLGRLERAIKVVPSQVVFQESDLSSELTADVTVRNRTRKAIEFEVKVTGARLNAAAMPYPTEQPSCSSDGIVLVSPGSGELKAFGSTVIRLTCQPVKPGKQTYNLQVKSSECQLPTQLSITMSPRRLQSLSLPDLPEGGTLDLGFCYMNARGGMRGVPFRLENKFCEPLSLMFRSNLAKQVYISLDPTGSQRKDEIDVAANGHETIFICVRPGGDASAYEKGQCRELIGGMRITVRSFLPGMNKARAGGGSGSECIIDEIMVKFRAMVGWSLLQLSTSIVDLGRVREIGGSVSGTFAVSNPSSQMPLKFTISSRQALLRQVEGTLVGRDSLKVDDTVSSDMTVEYSLPVKEYGLIEDQIVIHNLSCEGCDAYLLLRLFASDGSIEVTVNPPLPHVGLFGEALQSGGVVQSLAPKEWLAGGGSCLMPDVDFAADYGTASTVPKLQPSARRKLRKALSTGEFLSGVAVFEADTPSISQECISPVSYSAGNVFRDNYCLDLGIVFVSEDHNASGSIRLTEEGRRLFDVTDLRQYHSSCNIRNYTENVLMLQPFSDLSLVVFPGTESSLSGVAQNSLPSLEAGFPVLESGEELSGCTSVSGQTTQNLGNNQTRAMDHQSLTRFAACGPSFELQPYSTSRLYVTCSEIESATISSLSCLSAGQLLTFDGLLAFQKVIETIIDCDKLSVGNCTACTGLETVDVVTVKGSMCLSTGNLVNGYIDLGKVGYANGWEDVEFDVAMQNNSDAELIYQIMDSPDCFMINKRSDPEWEKCGRSVQAPRSVGNFQVTLLTSKLEHIMEAGPCSWKMTLLNCNNPHNRMELLIEAEMTIRTLKFAGLTQSVLLLPPLTFPSSPNAAHSVTQFMVENLSQEPLGVALELHQVEETESLVTFEVFLSSTAKAVEEVRLGPGEKIELRVSACPSADTIPPKFLRSGNGGKLRDSSGMQRSGGSDQPANVSQRTDRLSELSPEVSGTQDTSFSRQHDTRKFEEGSIELAGTFCLGRLYLFSSPHSPDCIPIHGALIQGPLFDVLPRTLSFQARMAIEEAWRPERSSSAGKWDFLSGPANTLIVRNLRAFDTFHFTVLAEIPRAGHLQSQASVRVLTYLLVEPMEGIIPPRGSMEVLIKPRPWSLELYQQYMNEQSGGEPMTFIMIVQEVDEDSFQGNYQSVSVAINPPQDLLASSAQDLLLLKPCVLLPLNHSDGVSSREMIGAGSAPKHRQPVLGLRGCTPVSGSPLCYDFNLGQQNVSSGGRLHWDLTLIGDLKVPLNYKLCTVSENDSRWLTISNCSGRLEPCEHKIVQLSFSTKAMGVYSTYLVVQNVENPSDLKMVHLSLEVVSPRNARPDAQSLTFFHVLVEGDRTEGRAIDMGEVFYNFWYRNRSFVIVNEATVAMEFLLSSSMDHKKPMELNFSLDNTSLKRFSSLTVDPKSSIRVWIYFCPGLFKGKSIAEDIRDEISSTIFVNCRLVKDYQWCIPFHASCRYPQIGISETDVVFSIRRPSGSQSAGVNMLEEETDTTESFIVTGRGSPVAMENEMDVGVNDAESPSHKDEITVLQGASPLKSVKGHLDEDLELTPVVQTIKLSNLYLHRQLDYVVRNDSLFFETEFPQPQIVPVSSEEPSELVQESTDTNATQGFHLVIVRPIASCLKAHREMILKQKYVEEHVTIYNRSHPRERYTVRIRITAGHLRNFLAALGSRDSYPFRRLELGITRFLSSFYALAGSLLVGIQECSSQELRPETQIVVSKDHSHTANHSGNLHALISLENRLSSFCFSKEASKDYKELFFDFQYLTDELVFYSLKERWSRGSGTLELAAVQLAELLYCTLYRCQLVQLCLDTCQAFRRSSSLSPSSDANLKEAVDENFTSEDVEQNGFKYSNPVEVDPLLRCKYCSAFLGEWSGQLRHFLSYFPDSRDDLVPLRERLHRIEEAMARP